MDGCEVGEDETAVATGALSVSGEDRKLDNAITGCVRKSEIG